jgi:hypothetical protein
MSTADRTSSEVPLDTDALLEDARQETGLEDFGPAPMRDGLERLLASLHDEADLTAPGEGILGLRLRTLLGNRLRIEQAYREHPEIETEEVDGPIFVVGLPRTGTTALSNLLACDPRIRSLRLWESTAPVPPPEAGHDHDDPRIAETQAGLDLMYEAFPRMASLYFQTATGPTECQDLLGMTFRTAHFDGMARVPAYTRWVVDCDMAPAYAYHRRVLRLLQWRCPPRLWHLKTPVHLLALPALVECYPDARFLWTHRDPAEVLGSVCSLIGYTRSWVSNRDDSMELGGAQVALWAEALRRGIAYRRSPSASGRFGDIAFSALEADPVAAVGRAYEQIGLSLDSRAADQMLGWAEANPRGSHGVHEFALGDFGLEAEAVRKEFSFYLSELTRLGLAEVR